MIDEKLDALHNEHRKATFAKREAFQHVERARIEFKDAREKLIAAENLLKAAEFLLANVEQARLALGWVPPIPTPHIWKRSSTTDKQGRFGFQVSCSQCNSQFFLLEEFDNDFQFKLTVIGHFLNLSLGMPKAFTDSMAKQDVYEYDIVGIHGLMAMDCSLTQEIPQILEKWELKNSSIDSVS